MLGKMRPETVAWVVIALGLVIGFAALTKADESAGGKDVFLKYKCDLCHSVSSAGITARNEKSGAPDLLDTLTRHKREWVPNYIRKKEGAGHESCDKVPKERDGKPHKLAFKGTPEEEKLLLDWLTEQKTPKEEEKR